MIYDDGDMHSVNVDRIPFENKATSVAFFIECQMEGRIIDGAWL